MPRYPQRPLPAGYAVVHRDDGYWLQRQTAPATWQDVAGPYTQRWYAASRAALMQVGPQQANDAHQQPAPATGQ